MLQVKKIPEKTGYYLTGFADAQGLFNVSLPKEMNEYLELQQVILYFKVSHHDKVMLALFKKHLKCGTLYDQGNTWHYEVTNLNALRENIIPFFKRFGFLSAEKKTKFSKFKQIVYLLQQDESSTKEVLQKILQLREQLTETNVAN